MRLFLSCLTVHMYVRVCIVCILQRPATGPLFLLVAPMEILPRCEKELATRDESLELKAALR